MGLSRRGWSRPEVLVVASTGVATFGAGVAGLLQNNEFLAVPTLAAAALLGSWAVYRQLRMPDTKDLPGADPIGAHPRVVPRQLPSAVAHFAGRSPELTKLTRMLDGRARTGATVVVSGTAGVGKTALAVHWAHKVRKRFPDGQLYVNLRGFDPGGSVLDPAEALRGFLDALDVPPQRIPSGMDAQSALYRSLLADRRMLVLLDNAHDAVQVRPLLPGTPGCLALVTSRNQLTGLVVADGAQPLILGLLTHAEARELLARRLGRDRVSADPQAVDEIVIHCAQLPLALAVVAARAVTQPHLPMRALAGQLRAAESRLDALTDGDPAADVRAVFSWSYAALSPQAARLFRLLGLHPGPDVSAAAAASLAGLPAAQVRPPLAELVRAHLVIEHVPGRYNLHDLLRVYATEQAGVHDPDGQQKAAVHRVLDHYLHTSYTGALLLNPRRDRIDPSPPWPGVTAEDLVDYDGALDWFAAEHDVLLAVVGRAVDTRMDAHIWALAWALTSYFARRGHWHHLVTTWFAALEAARRLADRRGQASAHDNLGRAYIQMGRYDDADRHLRSAFDLWEQTGDQVGLAASHRNLGWLLEQQGNYTDALDHCRQSLALFRAAGNRPGETTALGALAWCAAQIGDYEEALAACHETVDLLETLGDRGRLAGVWDTLGYVHHHLGHQAEAIAYYQQSIDRYREIGDGYFEATVVTHLGDTHHATGDDAAARAVWRQALTILDRLKHPDAEQVRAKLASLDPRLRARAED